MPTSLAYLDRDFRFVLVNAAYAGAAGYRKEKLIGRNHFELFPHEENQAIFTRVRDTGEPASFVAKPFVHPMQLEKGITYWDWSLIPIAGARGRVEGLALYLLDVTDRVNFELDLRKERDLIDAVLQAAGAVVVVMDAQGRIVRFNRFCEELTGYRSEEVCGKCFWDFLLVPEQAPAVKKVFASLKAGQFPNRHENYWVARDGTRRCIAWSNTAILDGRGVVEYVIGTGIDITETREAERDLRVYAAKLREQNEILDLAHVLVMNLEGEIVSWNGGAERLYGWPEEKALGVPARKLLRTRFPVSYEETMKKLLRDGHWEGELSHECRDGRRIFVASHWVLHRDEEGEPAAVLEVNNDITERKRAEESLEVSRRELLIRTRIANTFLSVSDDHVYSEVLKVVLDAMRSRYGFFGYIDESGALVSPSLTHDVWDRCRVQDRSVVFPRASWKGLWGRSLLEKRTIYANGGLKVPEGHVPIQRALAVPVMFRGEAIGQVAVANKETDYDDDDGRLLENIAGYIASILYARLQKDREHEARKRAEHALETLQRQLKAEGAFAGIVGREPKMLELFETIAEVARIDVPVLIQGESGTGKELVAAAIHGQGPRANRPFVPVNCSALPETLLESELFGHVRGAFSGAIRDKKGRFELADGGTIFLDEVGDLTPPVQVSLLRVLQEGTIDPVGAEKSRKVHVRVVSATNRNLRKLVKAGKFREDLFFRLCVVPVSVPPLRERRNDIPLLAYHILKQITDRELVLSEAALDALMAYEWPGNVRELQNALHLAVVKCKGNTLEPRHLPEGLEAAARGASRAQRGRRRKLTPAQVRRALEEAGGNKREAARKLGISPTTIYSYLTTHSRPTPE